jgi:hypothetical protein
LGPIDTIIQLPWLGHGREGYDIDIQAGLLLRTDHYAECLHCCTETNRRTGCMCSFHFFGKPYAPPVSGTEPRSARVGAMLGRPVNAAAARFFSFLCGFLWFFRFTVFFCFFVFFYFFPFFLKKF